MLTRKEMDEHSIVTYATIMDTSRKQTRHQIQWIWTLGGTVVYQSISPVKYKGTTAPAAGAAVVLTMSSDICVYCYAFFNYLVFLWKYFKSWLSSFLLTQVRFLTFSAC